MEPPLRVLIDYATGENWEMPLCLYENYLITCTHVSQKELSRRDVTAIQYWLATLTGEERKQVTEI